MCDSWLHGWVWITEHVISTLLKCQVAAVTVKCLDMSVLSLWYDYIYYVRTVLCISVLDSFTDLHFLHRVLAHCWCHNAPQREQHLCSFFYADLKEYKSKWEHRIKYGFCLGPSSVACSPPPNSEPVSESPCMNLCKWMFLKCECSRVKGGGAYLGSAVWLLNKHKQWL